MGQGIYRLYGYGLLGDDVPEGLYDNVPTIVDLLHWPYECENQFAVIAIAVDDAFLQEWWALAPLPKAGLPHIHPREAAKVRAASGWPQDVTEEGIYVSGRTEKFWKHIQGLCAQSGVELPDGYPVFLSDWH